MWRSAYSTTGTVEVTLNVPRVLVDYPKVENNEARRLTRLAILCTTQNLRGYWMMITEDQCLSLCPNGGTQNLVRPEIYAPSRPWSSGHWNHDRSDEATVSGCRETDNSQRVCGSWPVSGPIATHVGRCSKLYRINYRHDIVFRRV